MGIGGGQEFWGQGHSNQVVALATDNEKVFSCGMDDAFRSLSISDKTFE
jgi:hypothetical protein